MPEGITCFGGWLMDYANYFRNNANQLHKPDCEQQFAMRNHLISRRDKSRTGMRFVCRGADVVFKLILFKWSIKNIVFLKGWKCFKFCRNRTNHPNKSRTARGNPIVLYSDVQTGGSMPSLWQQKPDMKWEPKGAF